MTFTEWILWGSLLLLAYNYVGYAVLVGLWSKRLTRRRARLDAETADLQSPGDGSDWPTVSLIIAAYREENVILHRLNNALLLDYPADKLEIIIGCDGDEDLTGELVRSVHDARVRLIQFPVRRGKASVLNDCVREAKGEILVFSDANTMMDRDCIKQMVPHFRDPQIGAVCGRLVLTDAETGRNVDGVYWRYENYLKYHEANIGALLGVNGAVYSLRKELYEPIPANTIIDDFLIGMRVHLRQKRLLFENRAVAREETAPDIQGEFCRRVRIGAGGFQSLVWVASLLRPKYGRVAFAFWSHKVLRWMGPVFLIAALVSNVVLAVDSLFYTRVLLLQELFYLAAACGVMNCVGMRGRRLIRLSTMFVSMNAALLIGFYRWITGQQGGVWKRTTRTDEAVPSVVGSTMPIDDAVTQPTAGVMNKAQPAEPQEKQVVG